MCIRDRGKEEKGLTNGVRGRDPDVMDTEPDSWGWQGGGVADRDSLMDVLNGVLAVGS